MRWQASKAISFVMVWFAMANADEDFCIVFPQTTCAGPHGVDIEIANVSAASWPSCCDFCSASTMCRGWTFKSGTCYLKRLCPVTDWPLDPESMAGATMAPPAPALPQRCQSSKEQSYGWPIFSSRQEVLVSPWAPYLRSVYGSLPDSGYPICTWDLWYLHSNVHTQSILSDHLLKPVDDWMHGMGHVSIGDAYLVNVTDVSKGTYKNGIWINHVTGGYGRQGYGAAGNNTWIEVVHQGGGVTGEAVGMWFLYGPGSGIWFNTGRTRVFETHAVAGQVLCGHNAGPNDATEMVRCAKEAGELDSFQLQYDYDVAEDVEIVAVNLEGVYPCGVASSGLSAGFRSGWHASEPCFCDNDVPGAFLNCRHQPPNLQTSLPVVIAQRSLSAQALVVGASVSLLVASRGLWRDGAKANPVQMLPLLQGNTDDNLQAFSESSQAQTFSRT